MLEVTKGVRGMFALVRLCLPATLFFPMLVDTSGTSLPVWIQMNLTISSDVQWPQSRSGAAVWLDQVSETVWLFGGHRGYNETAVLNDLWKLDLTDVEWTELRGERAGWPSSRNLAVACGGSDAMFLVGGSDSNGVQRTDVWQYDLKPNRWANHAQSEDLPCDMCRFWCNEGAELFGVDFHNLTAAVFLQYKRNVTEHIWSRRPIHEPKVANARLVPDLTNLTYYPLWPSDDNFVLVFAPIKHFKIVLDENSEAQQPCLLWALTQSLSWKPLANDCELSMYQTCPRLPPNLRTPETIRGLPSCRTHSATWMDAEGNLWMYGGLSADGKGLQDTWRFNRKTASWLQVSSPCAAGDSDWQGGCRDTPGPVVGAATWRLNNTLFLFGGHWASDSSSAPLPRALWTLNMSAFSDRSALPVAPLGVFLIVLSGTIFLSLISCGLIIFAKCSSPLAPRIRPPVRTYGKVHYSPVSSTDVEP